jgi:hypothetical protein
LAVPLIAIAVAVLALTWGASTSQPTVQAAQTPAPTSGPAVATAPNATPADSGNASMNFRVKSGSSDCTPTAKPAKCSVAAGTSFTLSVALNSYNGGGYTAWQTQIDWAGTGLSYKPTTAAGGEIPAGSGGVPAWESRVRSISPAACVGKACTRVAHGALSSDAGPGPGSAKESYTGNLVIITMNCNGPLASTNAVSLIPLSVVPANAGGASIKDNAGSTTTSVSDKITINCVVPPPTPTLTPVPPTATPTITPTLASSPRMQKLPPLQNLFLKRQGTKIPPINCTLGTDQALLAEAMNIPISFPDPKAPSQTQKLGGFSFQVKYDPLKVCIVLTRGPAWAASPAQICTIQDSVTAPTLQGVARINCVTLGKATVVDSNTALGRILAVISVKPQPEVYSQIRANQDNGQVVQLNNEACKLTDLQGHAIPVFSCDDADVTIRFLEGDVEPDCQVNTLDTQAIAFRWGATKGSLIFNDRYNLEPSGTQADQDIDINDLQFVYGRFGSTCASPWPAQVPVKAK